MMGHAPWGQWQVYRMRHMLFLSVQEDEDSYPFSKEIIDMVRKDIGPGASFKYIGLVSSLPKTRSGKILRSTIRKIADGEDWEMPATIENTKVFEEIIEVIKKLNLH